MDLNRDASSTQSVVAEARRLVHVPTDSAGRPVAMPRPEFKVPRKLPTLFSEFGRPPPNKAFFIPHPPSARQLHDLPPEKEVADENEEDAEAADEPTEKKPPKKTKKPKADASPDRRGALLPKSQRQSIATDEEESETKRVPVEAARLPMKSTASKDAKQNDGPASPGRRGKQKEQPPPTPPNEIVMALARRRRHRQYIGAHDNAMTPAAVRNFVKKLKPDVLRKHWMIVAGGKPDVMKVWAQSDGSTGTHAAVLAPYMVEGTVVLSDGSGLSKLSKNRPLLEVMRLIHDPKQVIFDIGKSVGGVAVPSWIADNTAMFYPADVLNADEVVQVAMAQQKIVSESCTVQVGMGIHTHRYFNFGGRLLGKQFESAEVLAEDHTDGGEIAVTKTALVAIAAKSGRLVMSKRGSIAPAKGQVKVEENAGITEGQEGGDFNVRSPFFELSERQDDPCDAYRVLPTAAGTEAPLETLLTFNRKKTKASSGRGGRGAAAKPAAASGALPQPAASYPSGLSAELFNFITSHDANSINEHAPDVEHLIKRQQLFVLLKVKMVEQPLLMDTLAQAIVACEIISSAVNAVNNPADSQATSRRHSVAKSSDADAGSKEGTQAHPIEASAPGSGKTTPRKQSTTTSKKPAPPKAKPGKGRAGGKGVKPNSKPAGDTPSRDEPAPSVEANGEAAMEIIKSNGNIAIAMTPSAAAAVQFCLEIDDRFASHGIGYSCGVWNGDAYVFDLSTGARDVSGMPVNFASKLAEDFGEDGCFFSSAIKLPAGVKSKPLVVEKSGVQIKAKQLVF